MGRRLRRLEPAPAAGGGRRGGFSSPAGRPRGEPAVRHGAARERGRRRSAYEAPHGSVAPGPVSSGAESKRRRCPRSRARTARVTLLAPSLARGPASSWHAGGADVPRRPPETPYAAPASTNALMAQDLTAFGAPRVLPWASAQRVARGTWDASHVPRATRSSAT